MNSSLEPPPTIPGAVRERKTLRALLHRMWAHWQITHTIRRLVHPDETVRARSAEALLAAGSRCWPQLRRTAFRPRTRLAVLAADLLDQMGDSQGLIALLSQYADPYMYGWHYSELRHALQRIGTERIVPVLANSLEYLETPGLPLNHWSLAVAVYALFAIQSLQGALTAELWLRAITVAQPHFDDLRICRSVLTSDGINDAPGGRARPPSDSRYVGTTLVAVRRAAVQALVALAPEQAYDLFIQALALANSQVQLSAIYGMRRLHDVRALAPLQAIAADRRHPLARDARRAIEAFGTRLPDVLTLVRASDPLRATPDQLLRPATEAQSTPPETLLRAVNGEKPE